MFPLLKLRILRQTLALEVADSKAARLAARTERTIFLERVSEAAERRPLEAVAPLFGEREGHGTVRAFLGGARGSRDVVGQREATLNFAISEIFVGERPVGVRGVLGVFFVRLPLGWGRECGDRTAEIHVRVWG